MTPQEIIDQAVHPAVAIPAGATGALANMLGAMPHIINCAMVIYVLLLLCHKGWQMYEHWRDDPRAWGKGKQK